MGGSQLNLLSSVENEESNCNYNGNNYSEEVFWVCILPNYSVQAPDFCVFLYHSKG